MTVELTMLAYATALLVVLVLFQATVGVQSKGLVPLANNRDDVGAATGFHARMLRVVDNHREGLTMFAPVILVAAVANLDNSYTAVGAQLFFWGRLVHAILYVAGVPMVRPLAWAVGLVGTVMVLLVDLGILH
ncbi:MAG: MAPEG family protein [Terricaulis sp.]